MNINEILFSISKASEYELDGIERNMDSIKKKINDRRFVLSAVDVECRLIDWIEVRKKKYGYNNLSFTSHINEEDKKLMLYVSPIELFYDVPDIPWSDSKPILKELKDFVEENRNLCDIQLRIL